MTKDDIGRFKRLKITGESEFDGTTTTEQLQADQSLTVDGQQYDIGAEHITTVDLARGDQAASETVNLPTFDVFDFTILLQTQEGTDINMTVDGVADGDYSHLTRNGSTFTEDTSANQFPLLSAQSFRSGGAQFRYIPSNEARPAIYGNGGSHLFFAASVLVEGLADAATDGKNLTFSTPDARFTTAKIEIAGRNLR